MAIGSCVSSLVSYSGSVLHVGIGTRGADVEDAWGELSEAHAHGDPTARGPGRDPATCQHRPEVWMTEGTLISRREKQNYTVHRV